MKNKSILSAIILISVSLSLSAQNNGFMSNLSRYLENTAVYELNQEPGRTFFIPEKHISLNGTWKFYFGNTPEEIPNDFYLPKYSDKNWSTIKVPSNWEMQGFGDKLFRNVHAPFTIVPPDEIRKSQGRNRVTEDDKNPFKVSPPFIPKEYNPTGAYRLTFDLPAGFKNQQVFLRFEKVASASFVWINGQEVGYNEGAQEPSEYNITKFLKPGKNTLAVMVTKYSDGYYLEGQDYWRLAGIFDDVWLFATPNFRLFDWQVLTDLDSEYKDALLTLNADIQTYISSTPTLAMVKASLFDAKGIIVKTFESDKIILERTGKKQISLKEKITNPRKWTSETPDLYTLKLELVSDNGKVHDQISQRIGFKETEIRGSVFYLNGIPVKISAQNSHMQHPETGHTMDEATIRKDFEILKQFNFNAVRISHYPPVTKYLELADEYGLYIIDEAGVESHASEYVSKMPQFTEMYRERVRRMVLRDRNHPCIIFWSAGNESGEGFNITEVVIEGKRLDPSRYWMYGGNAFLHPAEDIIGPRYPTPSELEMQVGIIPDSSDIRPSFMDEYLSVAGNGGGGMDEYWKVINAHPRIMGGAIWDFVSTGITEKVRNLYDSSLHNTPVNIMGNAKLVKGVNGNAIDLNGFDQWIEIYRQKNIEISGDKLTLTCDIFPRKLMSSCGSVITKGNYQFGLQQQGKDSLDFYIYTHKHYVLRVKLTSNWENNWHQLTGVYDGEKMAVLIDGKEIGSCEASGKISNFPFPVNIGRNAEKHGQETHVYICDAIIDNAGIFADAVKPGNFDKSKAALWLDFENEAENGTFYSYGIGARTYGSIFPDRKPQPEMWQMKKTTQPVSVQWIDAEKGWVEIKNRNNFLNVSHYKTEWFLQADNEILQRGELILDIPAQSGKITRIPFTKPEILPGKEYRILITSTLKNDEFWAKAGFEIAWDQLELPWLLKSEERKKESVAKLIIHKFSDLISVSGKSFVYQFSEKSGKLITVQVDNHKIIKTPLNLNVWRAPLANELDEWNSGNARSKNWKTGFGNHVATEYYSTGLDTLTSIPISVDWKELDGRFYLNVREICLTGSSSSLEKKDLYVWGFQSNGFENQVQYIIYPDGELKINHKIIPFGNLPLWLPRIGITMILDKNFDRVEWYGRGPQENYPDRKTGYKTGIYQSNVHNMYEPYLIPQDYGLRTENRWLKMTDSEGVGLEIKMKNLFNFNVYPYSTENLTKAVYTYQLQPFDGITLNLDYATSGVGCTARSIFQEFKVMPQMYVREISITPVKPN